MADDVLDQLLAQSAWVQRLARSLVRDVHLADDLAQDAMVEALRRPPASAANLRGWFATVLRHALARDRRGELRRRQRELRAARPEGTDPDVDCDRRMARHHQLVLHVQALAEPHRSAIVLRFFDDLPPRQIARRLGVPVATVRSRVQRGLQQLRARLDAQRGEGDWLSALLLLGWPELTASTAGGTAAGSAFGVFVFMHAKLLGGFAALAVVGLWFWWSASAVARDEVALVSGREAARQADADAGRGNGDAFAAAAAEEPAGARERLAVAEPSAAPTARTGRVVDVRGQPIAGARVRHHGSLWPRWQSGDLGWINDGSQSRFVPPPRLAQLRGDPAAAAAFFAELQRPAAWRAVLLGEALPAVETATDADGAFAFADAPAGDELDLADATLLLLAECRGDAGELLLVAAPGIAVGGRVLDQDGRALPGAEVTVRWSPQLAFVAMPHAVTPRRPWQPRTLRAGDDGRYLAPELPAGLPGCELVATHKGHRPAVVPAPLLATDALDLVLQGAADAAIPLDGTVVDGAGAPVPQAQVSFGDDTTTTDGAGRFRFADLPTEEHASLTVLKSGYAPLQREDLWSQLRADARLGRGLVLRLDQPALALRGVALDADGRALDDVRVNLFDPTLLDYSFTPAEGRLGSWERGVATDAAGRFELGGLAARPYRLRIWRPDGALCFVSEPLLAGGDAVTVQVPATALHRRVHGTVRAASGALPSDLAVVVAYPIHIIKRGDGCMTDGTQPLPIAADGTFELHDVPRRDAWLALVSPATGIVSTPVEAIADDGSIALTCDPQRMLQVLGHGDLGDAGVTVLDAADRPLEVEAFVAGRRLRTFVLTAHRGVFPPCAIPAAAQHVLLQRPNGSWQKAPIRDDAGGVARAVVKR